MKQFIAIIGPRNSGKTTIIRSLVGCKTAGLRDLIEDEATGRSVYVIASSPQETPMTVKQFRAILTKVARSKNCLGVVMALQASKPYKRNKRKWMEDYFRIVSRRTSFQSFAFIIDPTRGNVRTNRRDIQNRIAQFAPAFHFLDARRFAHLNASHVNKLSNIVW